MPQPIICLDEEVRYFAERFRAVFSKPQYQYFVTVLLGLMECDGKRTLSGVLSQVGQPPSLSGLSRFFSEAPWVQEKVVAIWLEHFRTEMQPQVEAEREQQRKRQLKRRGRPKQPLVTGYVIGDDSTMSKPLTRSELTTDVTPTEVAAIWSVKHKIDINPRYVREDKRKGRIEPSREWGQGPTYRCLYRVREVLPIEVSHQRGRPSKEQKGEVVA